MAILLKSDFFYSLISCYFSWFSNIAANCTSFLSRWSAPHVHSTLVITVGWPRVIEIVIGCLTIRYITYIVPYAVPCIM